MYVDIKNVYCLFLLFTTLNDYSCYKDDNQDKKQHKITTLSEHYQNSLAKKKNKTTITKLSEQFRYPLVVYGDSSSHICGASGGSDHCA